VGGDLSIVDKLTLQLHYSLRKRVTQKLRDDKHLTLDSDLRELQRERRLYQLSQLVMKAAA
jgi:hypothetical protein